MTEVAVVQTDHPDSGDAGMSLGVQISEAIVTSPDVVILFISPDYDHTIFLQTLKKACHPAIIIGCSSAGEFTREKQGMGMACAVALRSSEMSFNACVARGLHERPEAVAREIAASFQATSNQDYKYRSAILFSDGLTCRTDDFIEQLTLRCDGTHQFFGAASGDNAQFRFTPVFYDTEVISDAVVSLEILSNKPIGVGTRYGWKAASHDMHVTKTDGMLLVSIDDMPAAEVFRDYVTSAGHSFDPETPLFFLHLIGISTGAGYKLRVPLRANPDGSITCASEIPTGATIRLMRATSASLADATKLAANAALDNLYGLQPAVALFFDCAATRFLLKEEAELQLQALQEAIGPTDYVGCYSHGQIARAEGQFSGFLNCTASVCIIPK